MTATAILRRAAGRAWDVRARLALKLAVVLLGLLPLLLLPWPMKILIDHVIVGTPLDHPARPFPAFVRWLVARLPADSPMGILWGTIAAEAVLLLAIGAFGTAGPENASSETTLAQGEDNATTSENAANAGWSTHGGLVGLWETWFTMRLTQDLNHALRRDLFARLLRMPLPALAGADVGDAVYRVMYDTPAITIAAYRVLLTPIVAPIGFALTVVALRWTFGDVPELVLAALAFLPLSFAITWPFAAALRRAATTSRAAGADTTSRIADALGRVAAVQGLGTADAERRRFGGASAASFATHRRMLLIGASAVVVAVIAGGALVVQVFLHVTDLVVAGRLSLGDVALLLAYFGQIVFFVVELGTAWVRLQTSVAGLGRAFAALDAPVERDPPAAVDPPARPARLRFAGVSVTHADGTVALHEVTAEARRGELTVVVGPAGSGKTTLASLVPGFVAPSAGRVWLDDVDVARVRLERLRATVAFAFQEPGLLEGTIADNVRLGRPDAGDADVARALAAAGLDTLPDGLGTRVGRRGTRLSVGQRHRVGLARAFLRDAPITILDEPSAALDPASERRLVDVLRTLRTDRILLVISHRLALAQAADRVLVLEHGRVVEAGSPRELASRPDARYRRYLRFHAGGPRA